MTNVAFLGTGLMGLPMARNLANAGFSVHAWNRSPERARPLADCGAQVFEDPRAATDGCRLMITMLSDGDAVVEVAAAALEATDLPDVWIQMSTIGLDGTQRCAELADDRDVTFVDAPVLGTRAPAEAGRLVVLGSGPESARPAVDPVFEAVGARTQWVGEAGAGSRAKLVVNSWIMGIVGVLAETVSLAESLEIDPQVFFDAIKGGPLDLDYAQVKGAAMVNRAFDDVSMRLALARKDGDLILAAAGGAGLQTPVMQGALTRLRDAECEGHGDEDMAATYWAHRPA